MIQSAQLFGHYPYLDVDFHGFMGMEKAIA